MPPEYRTQALVLRTFDQGESDRLVHLYCEGLGRVSAIAKGARRSRRRFPGTLELFSLLEVRLVDPPRSALFRLEGARLIQPFEGLVRDMVRYALASQVLELLDRLAPERQPETGLLRFAVGVLDVIAQDEPDRLLALLVLVKLIARLGYRPTLVRCGLCDAELGSRDVRVGFDPRHGGAVCATCQPADDLSARAGLLQALEWGIRSPLLDRYKLGLDEPDVRRLEALVRRFYQFHIGIELRTGRFLLDALDRRYTAERAVDGLGGRGDTAPARAPVELAGAASARTERR